MGEIKQLQDRVERLESMLRALQQRARSQKRSALAKRIRIAAAVSGLALVALPAITAALPNFPDVQPNDELTAVLWNDNFRALTEAITVLEQRVLAVSISGGEVTTTAGPSGTTAGAVSGGAMTVTFPAGLFAQAPTCTVIRSSDVTGTTMERYNLPSTSSSEVTIMCHSKANGSSTTVTCSGGNFDINLICIGE